MHGPLAPGPRSARSCYRGPLQGVPIAVKDLCFTKGVRTAWGTTILSDWKPEIDATVVERFRTAGAVLLGKLEMTEGAFADHHPEVERPLNPWHPDHRAGASSSGSGVATATGRWAPIPAARSAFPPPATASPA